MLTWRQISGIYIKQKGEKRALTGRFCRRGKTCPAAEKGGR